MRDWTKPHSYEPIDARAIAVRDYYEGLGFKVVSISPNKIITEKPKRTQ